MKDHYYSNGEIVENGIKILFQGRRPKSSEQWCLILNWIALCAEGDEVEVLALLEDVARNYAHYTWPQWFLMKIIYTQHEQRVEEGRPPRATRKMSQIDSDELHLGRVIQGRCTVRQ